MIYCGIKLYDFKISVSDLLQIFLDDFSAKELTMKKPLKKMEEEGRRNFFYAKRHLTRTLEIKILYLDVPSFISGKFRFYTLFLKIPAFQRTVFLIEFYIQLNSKRDKYTILGCGFSPVFDIRNRFEISKKSLGL
jgi:hypothetical protein